MPIFEYRCARCDRTFEMLVSRDEAEDRRGVVCPSCGKHTGERVLSVFAVGSGAADACDRCPSQDGPMCGGGACDFPD